MNKLAFFLKNNKILFLSWCCAFFCVFFEYTFYYISNSYLRCIYYFLFVAFIIFSIFYSFYQSIKNIKINKLYAFILLILHLMALLFFIYSADKHNIVILFISIFINIFIFVYLYHNFKKQSIIIFICLLFCSGISVLLSLVLLGIVFVHDL